MSEHTTGGRWLVPMRMRSPDEEHRAATTLELFFDLVFVVAVAQVSLALHHSIAEDHVIEGIFGFIPVFFAIWWAWMSFTWFASAFDCDDVPYRLATFVQLGGALILAAGVPQAFEGDYTIVAIGYVVMRLALVFQYLRAGRDNPSLRITTTRYVIGIGILQIGWVTLLFFREEAWYPFAFALLAFFELLVPVWAERAGATPWHPGHIVERYGLFTIIVLGESILATSLGIQAAIESGEFNSDLLTIIVGGLLIILSMWWIYFDWPMDDMLTSFRKVFFWGYGHFFVFASAAAVGAGLSVMIEYALHHAEIGPVVAGSAVSIPVSIFLGILWLLHVGFEAGSVRKKILIPAVIVLVLLMPFISSQAPLLIGLILVGLLVGKLYGRYHNDKAK